MIYRSRHCGVTTGIQYDDPVGSALEELNLGASLNLAMVPVWVDCVMHDKGSF